MKRPIFFLLFLLPFLLSGCHSREPLTVTDRGIHRLTIGYMQVGGGYFLSPGWKGPDIEKETVPPDRFFFR